jgi:serine/threonine protein phosphatase PrpC
LQNAKAELESDALRKRIERLVGRVDYQTSMRGFGATWLGTTLGSVRKENQDRALVVSATYSSEPQKNVTLAVITDGMGGLSNGGAAAVLGLSVFVARFLRTPKLKHEDRLRAAALSANDAVHAMYGGHSGTTLSAVMLDHQGKPLGVNVGDSRIYGLAQSGKLVQLTQDDTLAAVMGNQQEGRHDANGLIQFVGMGEGVEPHIISPPPDLKVLSILLTTDGIHGSSSEILSRYVQGMSSQSNLVEGLLQLNRLTGGRDNGTAIVLDINSPRGADEDQGLNLSLISPSQQLEIWIPLLGYDLQQNRGQDGQPQAQSILQEDSGGGVKQGKATTGVEKTAGRRDAKSRKRKKKQRSEVGLPLEDEVAPSLDIKFPETD